MQITADWTELTVDGAPMKAWVARPASSGSFPGVVLLQEIFGVNAHIRDVAGRIAAEGFVVVAPDIYHRTDPGLELGYDPDGVSRGRALKGSVSAAGFDADLGACLAWLDQDAAVADGRRGCIGFCFGGHLAFRAAANPAVGATASFYGAGIPTWAPGNGPPSIGLASSIQGRILCFFGGADASIPPADIDAIRAALQAGSVDHDIVVYRDANHGFFCDRRDAYDPPAAADAWLKVLRLFDGLA